ncbi:MAG: MFS transporter [Ramlibacter sp.]|nr:MFS transporter [Ramlibacter sp.]
MTAELARLILGHVFLHACMAGTRMAAPLWALREGYSPVAVGVLLALFALTQVFLALPAGRYADRHGLRRPVALSVLVACAGAALAALVPSFATLCVAALLTGGATGAASIALQRHVGRAAEGATQLRQVFSWLAIGPAVSNFLGPFAAGLLIDHAGFRWAFFAMALLPLTSWFWVRRTRELPPVPVAQGAAPSRAWDLAREPAMRRLLMVNWLLASCWDVHTFVVPVLGHERGFSASAIGSILGAFAIAAAVIRLVLPVVAARLKEHVVVCAAMVATAVLFGIYPLLPSAWAMGICSVLLGFALGSVQPMIMSMLHQITPHHRHGEALGLRLMAINASSVAMPLLFGVAGAAAGVSVVFWFVGALVGTGARSAWSLRAQP